VEHQRTPPGPVLRLGPKQHTAVAAALTLLASVVIVASAVGLLWLTALFLRRFSHVLLPLAVGAIAALVLRPYYLVLRRRLRLPIVVAVIAVLLSLIVPLAGFSWFFGAIAVTQIAELLTRFPEWWQQRVAEVQSRWPEVLQFFEHNPWGQRLRAFAVAREDVILEGLQAVGGRALSAGAGIWRWAGALVSWAVLPVYFVFFLTAEPRERLTLERLTPFLRPQTREHLGYLASEFVNIVVAFFRGQLIIALLQGLLFAIGFSAVGLRYGFVLGLFLGFLNVIPYLGSLLGLAVALPLAYFQPAGGLVLVGLVVGVFALVQLIEGYLLTPRIMGERTGLHPVAIVVAVLFWQSALGGILGMILAIPLTAFIVVFWRLAREKYIGELV